MKHSIRLRYTFVLVLVLVGVIGGIFAINNLYLEYYVTEEKKDTVLSCIELVEAYIDSDWGSEEEQALEQMCITNNIGMVVNSVDGVVPENKFSSNYNFDSLSMRLASYLRGDEVEVQEIYEQTDEYVLYRVSDTRLSSTQIECIGSWENGFYIISTSLEGIRESVSVTNHFLAYVGLAGILIGGIVVYFVSRRLTRPILQLAALSEQMAELNFDVRYEGKQKDEIGILGDSMNRMSEKLEGTISELRSANLQLEEDIQEKTRIDEVRREFLSNVSHELKTPIALIQGYSEGLKDGIADDDPESRDFYCDVIIDEAKKMNQIVKRLLNLDEMESGKMEPVMEEFDLVEVVRGVMQSSAMLSKEKKCTVILEAPEPLLVTADEFMMEEVIQNYLSNAYHHVSDPGTITVRALHTESGHVRVSVHNTGKGIPEEDLEHVWEKFYKVDKARTRSYGGSGIGLSIVKAIMNTHNGLCGAVNCDGGVEFWFELKQAECQPSSKSS